MDNTDNFNNGKLVETIHNLIGGKKNWITLDNFKYKQMV